MPDTQPTREQRAELALRFVEEMERVNQDDTIGCDGTCPHYAICDGFLCITVVDGWKAWQEAQQ